MTEWSKLSHAYGSADDIPALLRSIESEDVEEHVWGDLWSRLYHQGTVYSASFAALAPLAEIGTRLPPSPRVNLLCLAGCIVAAAEEHDLDILRTHATELKKLLTLAEETLHADLSEIEYRDTLHSAAAFMGAFDEHTALFQLGYDELLFEEINFAVPLCPHCRTEAPDDEWRDLYYAWGRFHSDEHDFTITPSEPSALTPTATRLYCAANDAGYDELATEILYLFGTTPCPDCSTPLVIADLLVTRHLGRYPQHLQTATS